MTLIKNTQDTPFPSTLPKPENKGPSSSENPDVPEAGGPKGLEPTRYGDWEQKGRCSDF